MAHFMCAVWCELRGTETHNGGLFMEFSMEPKDHGLQCL
ncbi:hypothetical protein Desaci_4014 [Desulfosporosinus acidiphilus SJ4]|uniref:Uncharacterized protein n=1 Tax=Desulfosporosinus acidiphilus (strain DSM 22704 / JCM 16185 / SJ4) TaxID=646529 RepID=I4DAQ6_DESAJ|nr:hypothetical protein Desaci_4014 [Desulfosporosinus acidiphilus SJ4]